jgi:hypothetical protein
MQRHVKCFISFKDLKLLEYKNVSKLKNGKLSIFIVVMKLKDVFWEGG